MYSRAGLVLVALVLLCSVSARAQETVDAAMDAIVSRLMAEKSTDQLMALDEPTLLKLITPGERDALASRYVHFTVNVPVIVSVMRENRQETVPFWLEEAGFVKTGEVVRNTENWTYDVWQKRYDAGPVGLGINGFDRHRQHYFVTVGPQRAGDTVVIENLFPAEYSIGAMHQGSFVYHDWDSLLIKEHPDSIAGHLLLTTIRGRAREAHLIGGFRLTATPSSTTPDQIVLTWEGDPKTTQAIQWRTNTSITSGAARYWKQGKPGTAKVAAAALEQIEDRVLLNDRFCHHFTASLRGLSPGTTYAYQVGCVETDVWSAEATFTTAPARPRPFSFMTFGDTHKKPHWGSMAQAAVARHPESAFILIAGDLVDTGQYRDDWDIFLDVSAGIFQHRPLIPTIGNHDAIDGLGAGMYRSQFALPQNGPAHVPAEHAYTIEYGNVLFIVLDSGLSTLDQAEWLEAQLAKTKADWKIAMYHFPPYNVDEAYPDIASLWGYLFDKYHLDLALEGHFHYYMRSHPIRRGRPAVAPETGTIHLISIGIENSPRTLPPAPYAAVQFSGTPLYQTIDVDGKRLTVRARDPEGQIRDEFTLTK